MHGEGYVEYPNEVGSKELIHNLRLDDSIRRVKLTLDERMLSIEQQYGANIDIHLNHIARLQHHSSHLVPLWTFVPALVSIWAGWRIVTDVMIQISLIAFGMSFILGRYITSKPTLTIQTKDLDDYSLYGNDAELLRLFNLMRRLQDGQSLEQARLGLEMLERGHSISIPEPIPAVVQPSTSIGAFLHEGEEDTETEDFLPDWSPLDADDPSPMTRFPDDHRPQPVSHPVLVPHSWQIPSHPAAVHVPMYQQEHQSYISAMHTPQGFLPSYITGNQYHTPQQHQEQLDPEVPEFDDDILEAELFEFDLDEDAPSPVEPAPNKENAVLRPRTRGVESQHLLRKKVRRQPAQKMRGAKAMVKNVGQRLRNTALSLSNRAASHNGTNHQSPSTAARLHQRSQNNARDAMEQLSNELPESTMDQIKARISRRQEVMNSLQNQPQDGLELASFGELQATSPRAHVRIRSIDEIND
jgi:hypothetical protein